MRRSVFLSALPATISTLAIAYIAPASPPALAQATSSGCGLHASERKTITNGNEVTGLCYCDDGYKRDPDHVCRPKQLALKIWIKSFIPNRHDSNPGFIRPLPGSPGKTMIPGPNIPYTNIAMPLVGGSCYNTNNRLFSPDLNAEAKITSSITLNVSFDGPNGYTIDPPVIDPTQEYDCKTGQVTCMKPTNSDAIIIDKPGYDSTYIYFGMHGNASDPCISAPSALVPSIKYDVTVLIDYPHGMLMFKGSAANFPSYEAYFSVDGGPATPIIQLSPTPGSTPWALLSSRSFNQTVSYVPHK
jgi:hypothetical protein